MTQHIRERSKKPSTPQVPDGAGTLASPLILLKHKTEVYFPLTLKLHFCRSGEYISVLCFSIRRGDARIPTPSRTWGVEGFLERSLMCWVITGLRCVSQVLCNNKDLKRMQTTGENNCFISLKDEKENF